MRDGPCIVCIRLQSHICKPKPFQTPYHPTLVGTECKGIPNQYPLKGDDPKGHKALHDGPKDILLPDHAAVKQGKARCHEHHQGAGCKDPRCIACYLSRRNLIDDFLWHRRRQRCCGFSGSLRLGRLLLSHCQHRHCQAKHKQYPDQ